MTALNWRYFVPPIFWAGGRKASVTTRAQVEVVGPGKPVWTPQNFYKLAQVGYESNIYCYKAIDKIATACGGIPWLLYRRGRSQQEIDNHDLLRRLRRPNPEQGQAAFIRAMVSFWLLAGNSYVEALRPTTRRAPPLEIWTLRPDRVTVIPDLKNRIGGYQYSAGRKPVPLDRENVLHLRLFSATNDWYGLAPIAVAAKVIDQHNAADSWNTSLLQNMARPSGAMVVQSTDANPLGTLPDPEYERLQIQLKEKFSGPNRAGVPMLLEGGIRWERYSFTPAELDWIKGKTMTAREIAITFGVPPEMLGDSTNKTYSNQKEGRAGFYTETVLPLMDLLRDDLNAWLVPMYDEDLYLDYDRDEIEALQEDRHKVWVRATGAFKGNILRLNEARTALGYEEDPEVGEMYAWQIQPAGRPPAAADDGEGEPAESSTAAHRGPAGLKGVNLGSEDQKAKYWKAFERRRGGWYGKVARLVAKRFADEGQAVAQSLAAQPDATKALAAAEATVLAQGAQWQQIVAGILTAVAADFGQQTLDGFKATGPGQVKAAPEPQEVPEAFDVWEVTVQNWIATESGRHIRGILETTLQGVREEIGAGIAAGEGIPDIAARLVARYGDFSVRRAVVIARTEVISASNLGSFAAAAQSGLDLDKEWLSTRDTRVRGRRPSDRFDHVKADGQRQPLSAPFIVSNQKLMFPGDTSLGAAAGNVIQCRCTQAYHTRR